jgi:hypothetical protein
MKSTSVKEVSVPDIKWTRSEFFGMPGRNVRPSPSIDQAAPELECVRASSDRLVQNLGSREILTGPLNAKRVA